MQPFLVNSVFATVSIIINVLIDLLGSVRVCEPGFPDWDAVIEGLRSQVRLIDTWREHRRAAVALDAITTHGVTIDDVLKVMPQKQDTAYDKGVHQTYKEDRGILKRARKEGQSLSQVLRDASERGDSGFEGDLIDWVEDCVRGAAK
jgi:hypothetical protein